MSIGEVALDTLMILIFLIFKGFFSGSEIAMVNSDKIKLRHQAKTGHKGAAKVLALYKTPDIILGTTLVGTNIATVSVSTVTALLFIEWLGPHGDLVSVVLFTPLLLILGEIVPKSIYQQRATTIAPIIIYPLRFFSILYYPIIFVFSRLARFVTRLVGGSVPQRSGFITRDELRLLLEMSSSSSNTDDDNFDTERVARITRFSETTVGEVMVPLDEVLGISEQASMEEAVNLVLTNGYNRLPVFRGHMSNIVGILTLNSWDLMEKDIKQHPKASYIQTPIYISSKQGLDQTIPLLQARPIDFMAVVVDEFGLARGILTMEDVLEEVVGEIDVGYDFEEYKPRKQRNLIKQVGEDEYLVDGRTPISQINDELRLNLPVNLSHTVAGIIINKLRRIPELGSSILEQNYRFTVRAVSARAITRVHIKRE
ncbi:MAG: hemolysin family protein [Chromatiaceae bacterium]